MKFLIFCGVALAVALIVPSTRSALLDGLGGLASSASDGSRTAVMHSVGLR